MPKDSRSLIDLVVAFSIFGLIISLWLGVLLLWWRRKFPQIQRFQERLSAVGGKGTSGEGRIVGLWHEGQEITTNVPGPVGWTLVRERMERVRREAGWEVSLPPLLAFVAVATAIVFGIAFILTNGRIFSSAVVALAVPLLFHFYLQHRVDQRKSLFEKRLLEALQSTIGPLRAGHPLGAAFRFTATEVGPPVGVLFGRICQKQELGMSLETAIREVAEETASPDMKLFAASVVIQLRSGGNLVDMMERLATLIRNRIRLNRRLRVLTAQTQLSKRILLALPFLFFIVLNLIVPEYMSLLFNTPLGRLLLSLAGLGVLIGTWVMNRLTRIRF